MTLDRVHGAPGLKKSHDVEMEADIPDVEDRGVRATGRAAAMPSAMGGKGWNERPTAMSNWFLAQLLAYADSWEGAYGTVDRV